MWTQLPAYMADVGSVSNPREVNLHDPKPQPFIVLVLAWLWAPSVHHIVITWLDRTCSPRRPLSTLLVWVNAPTLNHIVTIWLDQDSQTNKDIPITHDILRPRDYLPEAKGKGQTSFNLFLSKVKCSTVHLAVIAVGEAISCSPRVPLVVPQGARASLFSGWEPILGPLPESAQHIGWRWAPWEEGFPFFVSTFY